MKECQRIHTEVVSLLFILSKPKTGKLNAGLKGCKWASAAASLTLPSRWDKMKPYLFLRRFAYPSEILSMADEFFFKVDAHAPEQGPIDAKRLKRLAANGELSPESVLRRGSGDWVAASSVKGLEFAPAEATAYPEAVPVASPAGNPPLAAALVAAPVAQPKGVNLPGAVPPKLAPEGPAQIGSLNLSGKKGKEPPLAKPVLDLPSGLGDSKRAGAGAAPMAVAVPETAKPGMSLPPQVSPKASSTRSAESGVTEDANGSAEAAPAAPPASAPNPFATEPSARPARPRRGGGLGSLFSFDTLIGPTVIKTLFYLAFAVILLGWAGFSVFMIITSLAAGETVAILGALFASAMMLIPAFFYVVMVRVTTEMVIIFFQIHDDVRDMRELMENRPE